MSLTLADAADLTDRSIQKVFLKSKSEVDTSYEEIYGVEKGVTDLTMKDSSISNLGLAGRIVENAAATEAVPVQGYDQSYTQAQYGILFTVSKLQWFFGIKKRKLEQVTQEAVKAVANLRSKRLYEKLDNAWSTSYVASDIAGNYTINIAGGDSAALISTAHTREDGGTNNNNQVTDGSAVNMDFAYDALKAAHRTMALIRDPRGLPITDNNIDTIIVAKNTTNHFKAMELLGALKKGQMPENNYNDGAGVPAFKIHATPWLLSNPAYWFGMCTAIKDGAFGSLQYKESQDIELSPVNIVFKTKELQWTADAMFAWGHNDIRNIVGSQNDNN